MYEESGLVKVSAKLGYVEFTELLLRLLNFRSAGCYGEAKAQAISELEFCLRLLKGGA